MPIRVHLLITDAGKKGEIEPTRYLSLLLSSNAAAAAEECSFIKE
jgi:hypothetical protein